MLADFFLQLDGNSFLYTRHLNLYLVAVTRGNVNPAMVFEFLYQKIRIFKAYFKRDFDEDTLRNNMTLILELMDGELLLSVESCWAEERSVFHERNRCCFVSFRFKDFCFYYWGTSYTSYDLRYIQKL